MSASPSCPQCQQSWPRVPRFCPYCGQAQVSAPATASAAGPAATPTPAAAPAVAAALASATAAPVSAPVPTPVSAPPSDPKPAAPKAAAPPAPAAASKASVPPTSPAPAASGAAPTSGAPPASGATAAKPGAAIPPRPAPGKIPPFLPPPPKPRRWRQGLALVLLGGVLLWWIASPDEETVAIQENVAELTQQVENCELEQAGKTAQRLKTLDPEQYPQWQKKIAAAQPGCVAQRARARDWQAMLAMANKLLDDADFDKAAYDRANLRLNSFVKRWKEDAETRALKKRLDASYALLLLDLAERCLAKDDTQCVRTRLNQWGRLKLDDGQERAARLRAALPALSAAEVPAASAATGKANPARQASPQGQAATQSQASAPRQANPPSQARPPSPANASTVNASTANANTANMAQQIKQLMSEAQQAMAWGNYKGASAKLAQCLALPDKGNAVCVPVKRRADQLQQEMLRCVNSGNEWIGERCDQLK